MKEIKRFNNNKFGDIEIVIIDGKEYFPATECAIALGYINPHKAIRDHCKIEGCTFRSVLDPNGGKHDKKYINEGNLYRLIVKSKRPEAETFERWIFDEVIPSIRKHGIYGTDEIIDKMLNDPEYGIRLLTQVKAEREKNIRLEMENAAHKQIISELTPKASYYDVVLQSKTVVPITKIAKDYGLSGKALNQILNDLGIQYKMGDTWILYQKYAKMGYTQSVTHNIRKDKVVMHTYWTQKGRLFLYDILRERMGILPLIEMEGRIVL